MFRDNQELYDVIRALIRTFSEHGEQCFASALSDAMGISSMPGEVLGELRVQLRHARTSQLSTRLDVRSKIDESIRYIDAVLSS